MVPDIGDACGDFDDDHVRAVGNGFLTAGRCQAKGCQRYEADMQFTREIHLNGANGRMSCSSPKIHMQPEHEFPEKELESIIFHVGHLMEFPFLTKPVLCAV